MNKNYTKGTLRKPTNLDPLYPDPFNGLGQLEAAKEARVIRFVSWFVAAALVGCLLIWTWGRI